ncbi:hypothetical protein PHYPSEUDO_009570 [Phytophthora pseudosyringae]|uniref:Uncharacterized protein n=1 Tax=Phytophthora pseudosyringae TaxID=221518 RepID=A0A8T1WIX6_9STRA|nr:hypothetical protein PHYPSEUDO_009570 [Phytophthora pseudosyringae]
MGNDGVDASQVKMGISATAGGCCGNKSVLLSVLGFVFVLFNLAALWALHFADRPEAKGSLRAATRFSTGLSTTEGLTPSDGDVVSYNSDNVLRPGAGTTAYLNKLTLAEDVTNIPFVYFAPMGTSSAHYTNVMSHTRVTTTTGATPSTTTKSYVTTVAFTADNKSLAAGAVDETNNVVTGKIRGLATLSDTQMVVLTVATGASVIPATLNGADNTVKLDQSKVKDVFTTSSPTNFIAPLSSSSFVVAYYQPIDNYSNPTPWYQSVKAGAIDAEGAVTFSAEKTFGPINNNNFATQFGAPVGLKGLSASAAGFVVPYYTTLQWGTTKTDGDLSGICVTSATYSSSVVSAFSAGVCASNFRPGHYPEAVALSDNALAVVFYDTANDNSLTIATLTVSPDKTLRFRSSYVLPDSYGSFSDYDTYFVTPHASVLSGNRLAVSFHNPMLDGKLSVRVLGFSLSTMSIAELTPVLPVAPSAFSWSVSNASNWALNLPITHAMLPVGADGVVTAYVGNRNGVLHQNFAVVQAFGPPVGIVQSISGNEASITTQGKAEASGVTAGRVYYATTSGDVVAQNSTATDSQFFYTADGSMLVTKASCVGVATDDDTLFVSTAF